MAGERCGSCAGEQAAGLVRPGVKGDLAVRSAQLGERQHRLEHRLGIVECVRTRQHRAFAADPRGEGGVRGDDRVRPDREQIGINREVDEAARVSPLAELVIDREREPPRRDPAAQVREPGVAVRRILQLRDPVGHHRKSVDQRHPELGDVRRRRIGLDRREAPEEQPAKTGDIAREIVDLGQRARRVGAAARFEAVELRRALDLE